VEFTIYRDLASIAFVRCTSPIKGTNLHAEGTAFSIGRAVAKCRSEIIERTFLLHLSGKDQVAGIAAHPNLADAQNHAWSESIETLFLESLAISKVFRGIPLLPGKRKIWLGRVAHHYVCLGIFPYSDGLAAAQSVSRNPFKALFQTWAEIRNIEIYQPNYNTLSTYTKANRILGQAGLNTVSIKLSFRENPTSPTRLSKYTFKESEHSIVYFKKEIS
jgi:hypothetical protein